MKRWIAVLLMTASPVFAFDINNLSADEKAAFGAAVREYLMANPEVLVESINVLETRQAAEAAANDDQLVSENKDALFNDDQSWVGGNPEGDLTMVEFIDYRCGVCRKFNDEVREVVASDGNIRLILKEFPILGEDSENSSRFAVAVKQMAGDAAYQKAHEALIALRSPATTEALQKIAADIGVDAEEVVKRMNSEEVTAVLRANRELGQRMAIQGTPTFVIGDQLLRGVPQSGLTAAVKTIRETRSEG